MLRVAVPSKGALSAASATILAEAGYQGRHEPRDLTVIDAVNEIEFFFLRPKDIPVYVGSGQLDLGITGRDLALDSLAEVEERLTLGFGISRFRYAARADQRWTMADLQGKRVATAYPNLVTRDLAKHGIDAEVIRLDGAVEISVQLGVADAIADVVGTGLTLRQHGLAVFGDPLCSSEAVLVQRKGAADSPVKAQITARLQGVVFAQQYLMIDYDCPKNLLDEAIKITPGLESPTVAPLADSEWVAVRAMVSRKQTNLVMDRLAALGARAVLASDIRSCRL